MKKVRLLIIAGASLAILAVTAALLLPNFTRINGRTYYLPKFYNQGSYLSFSKAIVAEDLKKMERYMEMGLDLNKAGEDGITLLYLALVKRKYESFCFLLKKGADPDYAPPSKKSIVVYCLQIEDVRFLEKLIDYGVDFNIERPGRVRIIHDALSPVVPDKNFKVLLESDIDLNYSKSFTKSIFLEALLAQQYNKIVMLFEHGAILDDEMIHYVRSGEFTLKELFIKEFEKKMYIELKGSEELKEQQELVKYLKEKQGIVVNPLYPDGKASY